MTDSERSTENIETDVGRTALATAAARALESERADRLVYDPLAAAFVAAAGDEVVFPTSRQDSRADTPPWRILRDFLAIRSYFFDRTVESAVADGARQVVVLGAGLDARAFRLEISPTCTIFEVDRAPVLDFKAGVLRHEQAEAVCIRRVVAADLRGDWLSSLARAGFDAMRPTVWLAEGLFPYLPAKAELRLLEDVTRQSADASRIGIEFTQDLAGLLASPAMNARGSLGVDLASVWNRESRPPADTVAGRLGWSGDVESITDIATRLGRRISPETAATIGPRTMLLDARFEAPRR